jgi:hypothetical protein
MKNKTLRLSGLLGLMATFPFISFAGDTLHASGGAMIVNTGAKIIVSPNPDGASKNYEPVAVMYRVQILALKNPINLETVKVNGVEGEVYSFENNGITRYYMGEFRDLQSANEFREELVKSGFEDACIVAYKNGDRITIKESLNLLGEHK